MWRSELTWKLCNWIRRDWREKMKRLVVLVKTLPNFVQLVPQGLATVGICPCKVRYVCHQVNRCEAVPLTRTQHFWSLHIKLHILNFPSLSQKPPSADKTVSHKFLSFSTFVLWHEGVGYCISRNFRGKIFLRIWLTQTFRKFLFSRLSKGSCKLAYRVN